MGACIGKLSPPPPPPEQPLRSSSFGLNNNNLKIGSEQDDKSRSGGGGGGGGVGSPMSPGGGGRLRVTSISKVDRRKGSSANGGVGTDSPRALIFESPRSSLWPLGSSRLSHSSSLPTFATNVAQQKRGSALGHASSARDLGATRTTAPAGHRASQGGGGGGGEKFQHQRMRGSSRGRAMQLDPGFSQLTPRLLSALESKL